MLHGLRVDPMGTLIRKILRQLLTTGLAPTVQGPNTPIKSTKMLIVSLVCSSTNSIERISKPESRRHRKIAVHAKCSTVLGMNTNSKNKIQNMSTDNWLRTCCEFDFSFIKWKFDRMSIRRYVYGQSIFHLLWMRFLLTCLEQRQHDRTRL